jgi:hypothetical protein
VTITPETLTNRVTATRTTSAREVEARARLPLIIAGVLVLLGIVTVLTRGSASSARLDPDSPAKAGARALAVLLRAHGSPETRVAEPPSSAGDTVVFVATPSLLPDHDLDRALALAHDHDVVVTIESVGIAAALGLDAKPRSEDSYSPGCRLPAAIAAGKVTDLGLGLIGTPGGFSRTHRCYDGGVLTFAPDGGGGSLTLVGGSIWLNNDHLADEGNAALALNLISGRSAVTWVRPLDGEIPLGRDGGRGGGLQSLLPDGWHGFLVQLGLALVLLALALGRRLGPVVAERLPIAVRGTETPRGRARLWASARAHDRAALALREHARSRLATRLGLGPATKREALVEASSERDGRRAEQVTHLLYGPAPGTDAELVQLADDLRNLTDRPITSNRQPQGDQ